MEKTISVVIIENDDLYRMGALEILSKTGKFIVSGLTKNLQEGMQLIQTLQPDVVVLNIDWLSLSDLHSINIIKNNSKANLVILTLDRNKEVIKAAINLGANCCYCKNSQGKNLAEKFVEAVVSAYKNQSWIDPSISGILVENFLDSKSKTENQLSPKEVICLKLIASGMKNEVVASRMNVAEGTVRSYLSNIFAKLNVENKLNAIRKGIQTGIITVADMKIS